MTQDEADRLPILLTSYVAVLVVLTACMIRYTPPDVAAIVVSWLTLSISVGISFGHCVLNEP